MRRSYLSTLLFIMLFTIPLKSQPYYLQWTKGANFPIRLSEINAITCNNKIYVVGGMITNDNNDYKDNELVDFTFEYDLGNKVWTKKANMPFKEYDIALATANDRIFAIGSKTAMYNPAKNTWQELKSLEDGKAHLRVAVVSGKIYMIGFFECANPNKIMMYDPQTDSWIEKASIPTARLAPSVTVVKNKIYVIAGLGLKENGRVDISKRLQSIEVYDPESDTWEIKKPMPKQLFGAKWIIVNDNRIFFINIDSDENNHKYNTYIYHPESENWSPVEMNLPAKCYDSQGITLLNNKIYLIGGHDDTFVQYNDVFIGTIEQTNQ